MNKYLDQICVTSSMVKQAGKSELRDTAVIGATGVGTGLISNHVVNKLELNGKIAGKTAEKSTPLMSKLRTLAKNPGKVIGTALKSKGFRNGAKIGAIGGAIGLAGDYGAVKINKALEKKASNIYLTLITQNTQKEED
jgi:hypothetical protein